MNLIPVILISAYKLFISPLLPNSCRFSPACSAYCRGAYQHYGFIRATILSVVRIGKCHPFHPGGYDPLPTQKEKNNG
ncbi:membrane protein insertion efficiency factor YidD [bacterium]|nr:membrane protein insertion efficiency factor YidD [bacterium]MBU1066039.1 membrane protein insertion efficiency factor YidD [bacterium]MBU1633091.1 membrane protein insertion efficiency factor YidD [bacterium]MBU1874289.1 membrane protein insertion efficiency factor YidD [bacterium]